MEAGVPGISGALAAVHVVQGSHRGFDHVTVLDLRTLGTTVLVTQLNMQCALNSADVCTVILFAYFCHV